MTLLKYTKINKISPLVREIAQTVQARSKGERRKEEMLTTIEKVLYLKNAPILS